VKKVGSPKAARPNATKEARNPAQSSSDEAESEESESDDANPDPVTLFRREQELKRKDAKQKDTSPSSTFQARSIVDKNSKTTSGERLTKEQASLLAAHFDTGTVRPPISTASKQNLRFPKMDRIGTDYS
jgi:hypothetical protein